MIESPTDVAHSSRITVGLSPLIGVYMSDRPCNYCSLRSIKKRAKEKGKEVYLFKSPIDDGVYVHVRKPDEPPDTRSWDEGNKHIVAWFMELPDHCVC